MNKLTLASAVCAASMLSTTAAAAPTLNTVATDAARFIGVVNASMPQKILARWTPHASRSYARSLMLESYGWTDVQFRYLRMLWQKESGWRHTADNPESSAYGIPQILGLKEKDPRKQIKLGLKYIKHRYGTPQMAWKFWTKNGWY